MEKCFDLLAPAAYYEDIEASLPVRCLRENLMCLLNLDGASDPLIIHASDDQKKYMYSSTSFSSAGCNILIDINKGAHSEIYNSLFRSTFFYVIMSIELLNDINNQFWIDIIM